MGVVREFLFPGSVERRAIPPLDGGLGPNDRLERCEEGVDVPAPDALVVQDDGSLLVSSGGRILRVETEANAPPVVVAEVENEVTALADDGEGGVLVAIANDGIVRFAADGSRRRIVARGVPLRCVTALVRDASGAVYVTEASRTHLPAEWVRDLMEERREGRLLRVDPGTGEAETLLDDLAWPSGLAVEPTGRSLLLSQAWDHRVERIDLATRARKALLPNLPGYPSRIAPAPQGGFWLALFALRTHLVEFVLREREFREEMMRTIHPDYWIRPALTTIDSGLVPLQGGGIRKLGITKPWAPPRSYGLVCRFDADGVALESWHSRPGGKRHGVTAVAAAGGDLWVASKGGDRLLRLRGAAR